MAIHALLIGCNYPRTSSALAGCVNDARDWATALRLSDSVDTINKLENSKATRKRGHELGREILHSLQPGDWFWPVFSGHGTVRDDTGGDERSGRDQAIVWNDFRLTFDDEWAALLADRPKGTFVFAFLDCCHSASMHRGLPRGRSDAARDGRLTPQRIKRPRGIPFSRCKPHRRESNLVAPKALPGVILFAGCGELETEYSFDAEFSDSTGRPRPNGAFTYYALRALRTLRPGATFADWFRLVGGRRPAGALPTTDYPQQPAYQASRAMMQRAIPIL